MQQSLQCRVASGEGIGKYNTVVILHSWDKRDFDDREHTYFESSVEGRTLKSRGKDEHRLVSC